MSEDMLKRTFKSLKRKDADLSCILDTNCRKCCAKLTRQTTYAERPSPNFNSHWTTYSHPDYPGLLVLKHAFTAQGLQTLVRRVLLEYPAGLGSTEQKQRVRSNLSCLGEECPDGRSYWSGCDKAGVELVEKLRWISTGYHYDWSKREYRAGFKSPFPGDLSDLARSLVRSLARSLAESLQLPAWFAPDSALVNFYHPGDTLSFHQDELEWELRAPLLSVSVGLRAVLCVGGCDRETVPVSLLLDHGDVVVLSGESRTAYHAVPRVFSAFDVKICQHTPEQTNRTIEQQSPKQAAVEQQTSHPNKYCSRWIDDFVAGLSSEYLDTIDSSLSSEKFRKKIAEYLPRTRINISIRQVENHK